MANRQHNAHRRHSAAILDSGPRVVEVPPTFRPETLSSDSVDDYELCKTPEFRLIMECAINPANHLTHLLQMFCKDKANQPICQNTTHMRTTQSDYISLKSKQASLESDVLF